MSKWRVEWQKPERGHQDVDTFEEAQALGKAKVEEGFRGVTRSQLRPRGEQGPEDLRRLFR